MIQEEIEIIVDFQEKGDSAYVVAVNNGFIGTELEWIASIKQPALDAAEVADAATLASKEQTELARIETENTVLATEATVLATGNANAATLASEEQTELARTETENTVLATEATVLATENANTAGESANNKGAFAKEQGDIAAEKVVLAEEAIGLCEEATQDSIEKTLLTVEATARVEAAIETANNTKGWTPIPMDIANGADKIVRKLIGYSGGTGDAPTENIGLYFKADGTFTDVIADATNYKGGQGIAGAIGSPFVEFVDFTVNKTLVPTDQNKLLRGNSATDLVLTIPNNSVLALPIGFKVMVKQQGLGRIITTADSSVVIESPLGKNISEMQFAQYWLTKEGVNTWSIDGKIVNDAFPAFAAFVIADGGTYDKELFLSEYNNLPALAKTDSSSEIVLVPGAYKNGKIYGINRKTGAVVPIAFPRAGAATYFDKNGVIQTAPVNMPRIDYDPLTKVCKGYLQDSVGTNFIPWSNDFTKWTNSGFISVTQNYATTSYGKPMSLLVKNDTSSSRAISSNNSNLSEVGKTYTFRITIKAGASDKISFGTGNTIDNGSNIWGSIVNKTGKIISGPGALTINDAATNFLSGLSTVLDTVIECSRKYDTAGLPTKLYVYPDFATSTNLNASVLIACSQLEEAITCSSYIETTGSQITRPADIPQSITDIVSYVEATIFMNFRPNHNPSSTGGAFYFGRTTLSSFWYASQQYKIISRIPNPTSSLDRTQNYLEGNNKVATSYDANNFSMNANGSSIIQTKPVGVGFGAGILQFGISSAFIKNHIKALVIFSRKLTDAEHTTITT